MVAENTRRPAGRRATALLAGVCGLALALPLQAAVVADLETRNLLDDKAPIERNLLIADGERLRFDHLVGDELQSSVIYANKAGLLVDHRQKTFQVVDDESLKRLAEQLRVASSAVDAKLAKLQPEHHQLFVESLRREAANAAPAELEATEERAEKEGRPSRKYRFSRGGQLVREAWVTPWTELGEGGPTLKSAIADLAALFRLMSEPYAQVKSLALANLPVFAAPPHLIEELARLDGFPVAFTHWGVDGKKISETRLREWTQRPHTDADFLPPAGFQRKMS